MARKPKTTRRTVCEDCEHGFDPTKHHPRVGGATLSGAAGGAWAGAQVGIATAGMGIAATVPGAIIGGSLMMKAAKQTTISPKCGKRQKW